MEELELDHVNWWDKAKFGNVSVRSCESPMQLTGDSVLNPIHLLPFYIFQQGPIKIQLDYIQDVNQSGKQTQIVSTTALEATDVSLNWHDLSRPVVDINAYNISVNLIVGKTGLPLGSLVEVPVPSMTVGDWTVNEVIEMLPTPPEKEGLYPRLGVVNITNVTIHIVSCEGDVQDTKPRLQNVCVEDEHAIPNELFSPLNLLTKEAGPGGVDQTQIENVMKEATITAIRKYVLREEAIMETVHKSTIFIETIRHFLEGFFNKSGKVLDHHFSLLLDAIEDILEQWEDEWNEAMAHQEDNFFKLRSEWKAGWDTFKNSALNVEAGFENMVKNFEEHAPWKDAKLDVDHGWKIAKKHMQSIELNVGGMMEQFEQHVENKWHEVKRDIEQDFGQEWKKITGDQFKSIDSKFENFEQSAEQMWHGVRKDVEFDLDFAKDRAQEAKKAVLDSWDFARDHLSARTEAKKSQRTEL